MKQKPAITAVNILPRLTIEGGESIALINVRMQLIEQIEGLNIGGRGI